MEFLAQAEPLSLVMAAVWLFAAGMFPVGIMLGSSCSPCCGPDIPPCTQCTEGELPETLTVVLDNLPDQGQGPDLITLSFSACFGDGVAGRVTAPGGDPATDKGAISAVELTDGGSGYAKLGRVAPTITISGGSGTGATFTPTVTNKQDACNVDYWELESVAVSGGEDFIEGEYLSVAFSEGDTEEAPAAVTINRQRTEPTLVISAPAGSGAGFSITYAENGVLPETWSVASITAANPGSGYKDFDQLTFAPGDGDAVEVDAVAYIHTVREEPTLTFSVTSGSGSGALLTPTLAPSTLGDEQRAVWYVNSISIDDGGAGYAVDDTLTVSGATVIPAADFYVTVNSVDENGAITSLRPIPGFALYGDTGEVESVVVVSGGSYYKTGTEWAASVLWGGVYYREDAAQPPYVSTPTVSISQLPPSDGAGASITATVNSTPGDADFGKVTGLTIANGGSNYLAWQATSKCCGEYYNGMAVVVKRPGPISGNCVYEHRLCGVGNLGRRKGKLSVSYNGPSEPPTVQLLSEWFPDGQPFQRSSICDTVFEADSNITDCGQWDSVEFTAANGATATVTAGGEYDVGFKAGDCFICCKGDDEYASEITVDVSGFSWSYIDTQSGYQEVTESFDGTYVLARQNFANNTAAFRGGRLGAAVPWSTISRPSFLIDVSHGLCAGQLPGSFLEQPCPTCHKKCRTSVSATIEIPRSFSGGPGGLYLWMSPSGQQCSECNDTPQCRPSAGTYSGNGKSVTIE